MYKETIKYTDYNGVEREEDFYFALSEVELTELEFGVKGGFGAMLEQIIKDNDNAALVKVLKDLLNKSYGIKSEDGKRFMKSEQISREFMETPAYSEMFMMLVSDEKKAVSFVKNIIPAKLAAKAETMQKANVNALPSKN